MAGVAELGLPHKAAQHGLVTMPAVAHDFVVGDVVALGDGDEPRPELVIRDRLQPGAFQQDYPLESNALGLRYGLLHPGPDHVLDHPEQEAAQTELRDRPSMLERRMRKCLAE